MRPSVLPASLCLLLPSLASSILLPDPKYPFTHPSSQLLESLSPFPGASFTGLGVGLVEPAAGGPAIEPTHQPVQTATTTNCKVAGQFWAAPKEECPPCNPFNCVLPSFACLNNGE